MTKAGEAIFTPDIIAERAEKTIQDRYENREGGLETGIQELDQTLLKLHPGELFGVLGFTSNYKSGIMAYIMRYHAHRLKRMFQSQSHNKIVITGTWEQSIEEQAIIDIAQITILPTSRIMQGDISKGELQDLHEGAIERGKLPWWLIGHSVHSKTRRPRLSMTEVDKALEIIDGMGFDPVLIALDYLQRIRREKADMREGYMDIVDKSKDLSLASHCPVMLGCQAKREVQARKWKLPNKDDAQETSNFEQSCDKMVSSWLPKNDYPENSELQYGDLSFTVKESLLLMSIAKQKFGKAPHLMQYRVNLALNEIYSMTNDDGTGPWWQK